MNEYHIYLDGASWCAVFSDFVNLQESNAGFGDTPLAALGELIVKEKDDQIYELCREIAALGMGA